MERFRVVDAHAFSKHLQGSLAVIFDCMNGFRVGPDETLDAIAVFPEEEGSRFGLACLGSQLMTGAVAPDRALGLKDPDGTTFADGKLLTSLHPYVGAGEMR